MAKKTPKTTEEQAPQPGEIRELPLVALRETVIFPEMIVPLQVGREKSVAALNAATESGGPIALVTQRTAEQEDINDPSELYSVGTIAKIAQVVQLQDGTVRAIVQGQGRVRIHGFVHTAAVPQGPRRGGGRHRPGGHRGAGADPQRPGPDRAVRRERRTRPAGGRRRRAQHHGARPPRRHGGVQPRHVHRAAPGAPRDLRCRAASQARERLSRPPDRDPRAEGEDPERGQVRDGQDPARVHPARAAQGHPARAGRGRSAAGRDQRAARQGGAVRHARGGPHAGHQGDRPDEPDPVRLTGGRRHPDLRGLARQPSLEHLDR